VGDVLIIETSHHVNDSLNLPDLPQKVVAKPFTLTCSSHQASDIHKLNCCRCDFLRVEKGGDFF